jgi:hypothetical protein
MRPSAKIEKWIVYETISGPNTGIRSVCTTGEWSELELRKPGENRLVQNGIANENEADKLARGASGDQKVRDKKPRPKFE